MHRHLTPALLALLALFIAACGTDTDTGGGGAAAGNDSGAATDGGALTDGSGSGDVATGGQDGAGATDAATVCKAGEAKCGTGAAVTRLVCKADGSGWEETICEGLNATCANGTCVAGDASSESDAGADSGGGGSDAAIDPCGGLCTPNQTCVQGICKDGAPCGGKCPAGTKCVGETCVAVPCGGPCPDGQFCDGAADGGKGKCVTPTCQIPKTWGPNLQKISLFKLKPQGKGCDLNGDGKEDNAVGISMLLDGVNNFFNDEMVSGERVTFLNADAYKTDGSKFDITLLTGSIDDSNKSCDKSKDNCKYTIGKWNYDFLFQGSGQCPPVAFWESATAKDGALKAGSDKQVLKVSYPFEGDAFAATIRAAYISGTVTDATNWKGTKPGLLCGVLTQKELFDLIDAIPDSQLGGLKKSDIKSLLPSFVTADIDTDGDNKPDAYSAAFDFESIPATITGIK